MEHRSRMPVAVAILSFVVAAISHGEPAPSAPTLGGGTPGSPYQISTIGELYWITQDSTRWDKHYVQTADIDASESTTWDSGAGFTPIGDVATPFTGGYDGNGFPIDGLSIDRSAISCQGMFGATESASLSNIRIENADVSGNWNVGILAGDAMDTVISVCTATGTVASTNNYCGGLVGRAQSTSGGGITACSADVTIVQAGWWVGGLIGWCSSVDGITDSHADGELTGVTYLGGLVGTADECPVSNCYATCNVDGINVVGGFAGNMSGSSCSTTDSYATGNVTGEYSLGGFAGIAAGSIERCYATGYILVVPSINVSYAGGFAGRTSGNDDTAIANCFASGNVDGNHRSGGFVGYVSDYGLQTVTNSYSVGLVMGTTVGGFGGEVLSGTFTGNFWDTVTSGHASSSGSGPDTATGRDSEAMRKESTFTAAAWDFVATWSIEDGASYPYLLGLQIPAAIIVEEDNAQCGAAPGAPRGRACMALLMAVAVSALLLRPSRSSSVASTGSRDRRQAAESVESRTCPDPSQ